MGKSDVWFWIYNIVDSLKSKIYEIGKRQRSQEWISMYQKKKKKKESGYLEECKCCRFMR